MNIRNLLLESMLSFSSKELQSFGKYLRSPYFRKEHVNNTKIYELYKILKLYFLQLPPRTQQLNEKNLKSTYTYLPFINWDNISEKLFSEITCLEERKPRLNKLCSELISYTLDFFTIENFRNRKVDYRIFLSEEILNRNLSSMFEHSWKVKYFSGIYSEDEISNIFHRYMLIHIANLHKEKCKQLNIDYELELMLFRKYNSKTISEIHGRAEENGYEISANNQTFIS